MAQTFQVSSVRMVVHVQGLRDLSKACKLMPKESQRAIRDAFRTAAEPIADRARQLASAIADTGAFRDSISIQGGVSGVFLRATDPGAGPIEFARPGALATSGPGVGKPIGVPHGTPARVLFPAIDDTIDEVAENITDAVERTWILLTNEVL